MGNSQTLSLTFSGKHKEYIRSSRNSLFNIAEGAVRAGKTVDNVFAFAYELETSPDKIHLATGSTIANAKLNLGECNGLGLEYLFRGRCKWGKFKGNECLYIRTSTGAKIVIFAGGAKADSFKKIRGNSYGFWIATEINLHHDNTIKEAFNRQLAAKKRKIFWDLNPSSPKDPIYTEYIDKYQKLDAEGTLKGGYNYQKFTIFDNVTVSPERLDEILSQYIPGSLWHRRDILGERVRAEGLIYPTFAEHKEKFIIDNYIPRLIDVGVDYGENKSAHAFVAVSISPNYSEVVYLASEKHNAANMDPQTLANVFCDFISNVQKVYGVSVSSIYCDSAQQTLTRGLRTEAEKRHIYASFYNARKSEILNRIALTAALIAQNRLKIVGKYCPTLIEAMETAAWDPESFTDKRLDDGTTDIDSMDASEYAIENYMRDLMDYRATK